VSTAAIPAKIIQLAFNSSLPHAISGRSGHAGRSARMYFHPSHVYTLSTGKMLRLLDLNFTCESIFVIHDPVQAA
jgi:hypothetical protein